MARAVRAISRSLPVVPILPSHPVVAPLLGLLFRAVAVGRCSKRSLFSSGKFLLHKAVMSLRRSQSVDRRRRVLADESRNENAARSPRIFRGDSDGPLPRYNHSALQGLNAPIASYLPLRPYSLCVWFLVGLIPIFGLLVADQRLPELASVIGVEGARPFALTENGNLMSWVSAMTFALAIAVMLGIYSVRRHRRDDYRGHFTVWRWAILTTLFVGIDATVGLHDAWQGLCLYASGTNVWGDGSIWWVATWFVLFGGMLIRIMFEMASSRHAIGWACAAGGCYLWAGMVELDVAPIASPQVADTSQFALLMLGHHLLLFSLVQYAREVVLEAMGLVESPAVRRAKALASKADRANEKQRKAKESAASAKRSSSSKQDDAAKTTRKQAKTKGTSTTESNTSDTPTLRAVSPDEESARNNKSTDSNSAKPDLKAVHVDDSSPDAGSENRQLSRAERKRLKKEQRRQQRKAA